MRKLYEKIIMHLANNVLTRHGGKYKTNEIVIVRQTEEFNDWCYGKGYKQYWQEKEIMDQQRLILNRHKD